jgi:MFS family permease
MFVAGALPRVLFGSLAGVFVDRWDRKRTMIVSDLLRAVVLLPILFASSEATLWIAYVVGFVQATISLFFFPAKGAVIPRIVPKEDLVAANSLSGVADAFSRIVGPALGGALLGLLGFGSVVLADSLSFLVSALTIALMAVPGTVEEGPGAPARGAALSGAMLGQVWRGLVAGLRVVKADPALTALLGVLGLVVAGDGIINVVVVAFTKGVLGAGAAEFGYVMTAQGVGALVGGILIGQVAKDISPARLITVGFAAAWAAVLGIVVSSNLTAAYILMFLAGIPIMGANVGVQTLFQRSVGDAFRGRIFGTVNTTTALASLGGMGLGTALAAVVGAAPVLALASVGYLLASGVALIFLPTARAEAKPQVAVEEAA